MSIKLSCKLHISYIMIYSSSCNGCNPDCVFLSFLATIMASGDLVKPHITDWNGLLMQLNDKEHSIKLS